MVSRVALPVHAVDTPGVGAADTPAAREDLLDDSLDRLRAELRQTSEFVAVELPRLAGEVSQIVARLGFGRERQTLTQLTNAKASLQDELAAAVRWMLESRAQLERVLAELRPGIDYLRRALREVRSEASELRILALNASCVALRGGGAESGRRGFAAATKELIQIAAEQMREAEQVIRIVDGATERFTELQAVGEVLVRQVDAISTTAADSVLELILTGSSAVESRLAEISELCQVLTSGIGHTMVTIQHHDILTQGLNHIELVEQELERCEVTLQAFSRGESQTSEALLAAVLQRRCGRLCADLLQDIHGELGKFLDSVEEHLHQLLRIAKSVRQVTDLAHAEQFQTRAQALCDAVAQLEQSLDESGQAQARKNVALDGLNSAIQPLPGRLRTFVERQERIRTLGILIRRQHARSQGLAGAKTVGDALEQLLLRGQATWDTVLADVSQIRTRMKELASEGSMLGQRGAERIVERLTEVESLAHRANQDADSMMGVARQAMQSIEYVTRDSVTQIRGLRRELERTAARVELYSTISANGAAFIQRFGAQEADVELPEALHALIERFTILSHKRLARTGDLGPDEQEQELSSVTLF